MGGRELSFQEFLTLNQIPGITGHDRTFSSKPRKHTPGSSGPDTHQPLKASAYIMSDGPMRNLVSWHNSTMI